MKPAEAPLPREVDCPTLTDAEMVRITRAVFRPSVALSSDVLFVFGTVQADRDGLACGWRDGRYPRIVLAGRTGPAYTDRGVPTALVMREELVARGVDPVAIGLQDRSTNTLEDVVLSVGLLAPGGRAPRRLTFASKAHHSGRCYLTLRRFLPRTELVAHCHPAVFDGVTVEATTWTAHPVARARVCAEYLRITNYAARGDIASPGS